MQLSNNMPLPISSNDQTQPELPLVLTIEEFCRALRIGRNTAYRLIQSGQVKALHPGNKFLIPRDELYRFLKEAI